MKVNKRQNKIFSFGYFFLLFLPFPYIVGSTYSYYSVQNAIGKVPGNFEIYEFMVKNKDTVYILPFEYGEIFLTTFMGSLFAVPFYILVNYIASKYTVGVSFHKKTAVILVGLYLLAFVLVFRTAPFGGWYLQIMLD